MATRRFDHIDLRVRNMDAARAFYGELMPALGFTYQPPGEIEWQSYYAIVDGQRADFFGFTEDEDHQPNGTRIAFWADTREEVDRLGELVRRAGAKNIEGPELCVEYTPGYYAVFFEDRDGNKLEICCRQPPPIRE